jgi:hypothetical protein
MTKRKNISQPDEAWSAWDRAATKMDMTLSQLIFEAMNEHLGLFLPRKDQEATKDSKGGSEAREANLGPLLAICDGQA